MKRRKRWGTIDVDLQPVSLSDFRCVYVDAFSIAGALSDPEEIFRSAAESGLDLLFVIDGWQETQLPIARRYLEYCKKWNVRCVLSERRPAEEYAVELACCHGCAVATRDYDALRRARELNCDVPVLIFKRGRFYLAKLKSS